MFKNQLAQVEPTILFIQDVPIVSWPSGEVIRFRKTAVKYEYQRPVLLFKCCGARCNRGPDYLQRYMGRTRRVLTAATNNASKRPMRGLFINGSVHLYRQTADGKRLPPKDERRTNNIFPQQVHRHSRCSRALFGERFPNLPGITLPASRCILK